MTDREAGDAPGQLIADQGEQLQTARALVETQRVEIAQLKAQVELAKRAHVEKHLVLAIYKEAITELVRDVLRDVASRGDLLVENSLVQAVARAVRRVHEHP